MLNCCTMENRNLLILETELNLDSFPSILEEKTQSIELGVIFTVSSISFYLELVVLYCRRFWKPAIGTYLLNCRSL